ncbi:hypothetical protein EVAR_26652_1 [Eumeta japonica]|uniref:Uncharacterized protein n=1 Tax=Eumeta variegata TaxID=151549 RepID=A0A4C1VM06_EUMVA|nr:hypothetical protein EVAR_26652_1 [Eumeta japonica]
MEPQSRDGSGWPRTGRARVGRALQELSTTLAYTKPHQKKNVDQLILSYENAAAAGGAPSPQRTARLSPRALTPSPNEVRYEIILALTDRRRARALSRVQFMPLSLLNSNCLFCGRGRSGDAPTSYTFTLCLRADLRNVIFIGKPPVDDMRRNIIILS